VNDTGTGIETKTVASKQGEGTTRECLTGHVDEALRLLVNISRVLRFHYEQFIHELLYTFIKVTGGIGLEQSRPVGLLEILSKGSKAVDYAGVSNTWERLGFLHGSQHAFRRGRGTEGLLMLWILASEESFRNKTDQARGQGDLKRAYDSVFQWFLESALLRAGLPKEFVRQEAALMLAKLTKLITAFGLTESLKRAAGLPQGGTESCAQFNAVMDVLACMMEDLSTELGVMLPDQWGRMTEELLGMFCDDTHYGSSGPRCKEGLEERFEIATLWGAFCGMIRRAEKGNAIIGRYTKDKNANERVLRTQADHGEVVVMRDVSAGTAEEIRMIDPYDTERALGTRSSLAGYNTQPIAHAAGEAKVTATAIRKMPCLPALAVRAATGVGWARLVYRLRFTTATPNEGDKACMPLKKAVLEKVGMHPGAARAAVATMV
jgi:hypothetical protein